MSAIISEQERVLSGMRPTGPLHLGHYHGVLKNWLELQHQHDCLFFVADWHALTTHYDAGLDLAETARELIVEWLAVGIDPRLARIFVQSQVPEHAELHVLLSMITPLGWLERVPSYKDQQAQLAEHDLTTYGFLGYPLLQSADILVYRASRVPVGEDQVAHVELTREIARRFNHLFGLEPGFERAAEQAARKMGKKAARLYRDLRRRYQEQGDDEALAEARALLAEQHNLTVADQERLLGYVEGSGRSVLPEPAAMLTEAPRMPGLDGRKMSKSYGNTIGLREPPDRVAEKIRRMPTDPARVKRSDPGDPDKCPVYDLHRMYGDESRLEWVREGCRTAGIGCLECKKPLTESVVEELRPIQERIEAYESDPEEVSRVLQDGRDRARELAVETLDEVRRVMGVGY